MNYIRKREYEAEIAASRDRRMAWFRDARFGMFIHYGLYSKLGARMVRNGKEDGCKIRRTHHTPSRVLSHLVAIQN